MIGIDRSNCPGSEMYLYHFSEDPTIVVFEPRPVRTPVERRAGQEWLNGSLVWAIDKAHSFL